MKKYLINFTVGDWSGDGHSQKDVFIVESSHSVEHLREVHFKSKEVLGFDIGDLFKDYGESVLSEEVQIKLLKLGILEEDLLDEEGIYSPSNPEEVLSIWLGCLSIIDKTLKLKQKQESSIPSMHFYGKDSLNRHLNVPGYGLYE